MKKIAGFTHAALVLFFVLSSNGLTGQSINPKLSDRAYSLIQDEQTGMAVSVSTGLYESGIGKNLEKLPDIGGFQRPEFLVLEFFNMIKNADINGMMALYDPESREMIRERLDIAQASKEYQSFNDFELFSKNVFGNICRVRFNFINTSTGDFFPWVLMMKQIGNRYFLTETILLDHLFISTSSAHPYNLSKSPYLNCQLSGMAGFYFIPEGDSLRFVSEQPVIPNAIGIWLNLVTYDPIAIEEHPTDEVLLLNQMRTTLVTKDSAGFVDLWAPEEKEALTSDVFQSDLAVNRVFYNKTSSLMPLGLLKVGEEIVVFFRSKVGDAYLPLQLMAMKKIGNDYKLRSSLDTEIMERFYAWQILNNTYVTNAIEQYFTR
jgi:hypothetical protein